MQSKKLYHFRGKVTSFGRVVNEDWDGGYTWAPTPERAMSNFTYRYKKEFGHVADSNYKLIGNVTEEF